MEPVIPGIYTWSHFSEEKKINFNGYVVVYHQGSLLIDPPPMSEADWALLPTLPTPDRIYITNKDHTRNADDFRKKYKIPVYMHELDAPLAGIKIDKTFKAGERFPAGLEVVHIPYSKSPGECAFYLGRFDGVMIVGDALMGGQREGDLSLCPADKYKEPDRVITGLRCLLDYPFETLLVGDGASIREGARKKLEEFLNHVTGPKVSKAAPPPSQPKVGC